MTKAAALPNAGSCEITNAFSSDWLTFEIVSGGLDVRAAAPACKALIKTPMSGYEVTAGHDAIPSWVSGHEPDRAPTRNPHLAAVPLAFAGFEHADGALVGLALVPPRGRADLLSDAGFRKALIAAVSYELQRFSARYCTRGPLRVLLYPGFLFQKITTREPDAAQIEVAIAAMEGAVAREREGQSAPERVRTFPELADALTAFASRA